MIGGNVGRNPVSSRCSALLAAALAAAFPVFALASGPDQPAVLGYWMDEPKKVAVEIYTCEENLCARIAWLARPYTNKGNFRRDKKNPNPALRDRGWCGIQVIDGLKPREDGVWESGRFYYPKRGETYDVDIELKTQNRLEMRAYLGIRLLGKSETWNRAEPDRVLACPPAPES